MRRTMASNGIWAAAVLAIAGAVTLQPAVAAAPVAAAPIVKITDGQPIKLTSAVYQEQLFLGPDGSQKVRQVPATLLTPGSELVYVITYANLGSKPADIVITNPWPADLAYRSASSTLGNVLAEVSVDGGKTFGSLGQLMVTVPGGGQRRAHAGDVTTVRWKVPQSVRPGEQGAVSLRAVVR